MNCWSFSDIEKLEDSFKHFKRYVSDSVDTQKQMNEFENSLNRSKDIFNAARDFFNLRFRPLLDLCGGSATTLPDTSTF